MATHVVAQYQAPTAVFEVVEDSDFFASSYVVRERISGRIVSRTFSTKRRAVAMAEEEAARQQADH